MILGTEEKIMINKKETLKYKSETISYEIIRSKIKNLYIYVKEGKVTVKAPIKINDKLIQEFVNKKAKWIYDSLKKEKEHNKIEKEIGLEDVQRLGGIVENYIEKYTKLLKETPNKVRIRDIKYAWGSCSSNRNITINQKLANKKKEIIEYVVLHEMCHLKYMNHSKDFWDLLESHMPEYKKYRKILKE